jgi:hypothetical protein
MKKVKRTSIDKRDVPPAARRLPLIGQKSSESSEFEGIFEKMQVE